MSVIGMTPSCSRVRTDRVDLELVSYALHLSMGKRIRERQPEMWVATTNFPTAASHPFYTRLNQRLAEGNVGGDDEFSDGRQSPILLSMQSAALRAQLRLFRRRSVTTILC